MSGLPPAIEERLRELPGGLRDHIERAREVAHELAQRHDVDVVLADLGTAAHDLARALDADVLLAQARRYRLRVHLVERHVPLLLHGPVASRWLQCEGGIKTAEVVQAVRWHTTGRRGMGLVEKVVFLADKLDPQKVRRYQYLERVRSLAQESLDLALLEYLNQGLSYLLGKGQPIHPESLELRNELLLNLRQLAN